MLQDDYSWECPKCGDIMRGQGPASLRWAKDNHEYMEHERKERDVAMPGAGAIPKQSYVPPVLVQGLAALDDAFYDGARLSDFDFSFLRASRVSWKTKDLRP